MLALFDSSIKVNAIHPPFTQELGFLIRSINVGVQKIDGNILDTYGIIVVAFLVINKVNRIRFFEKTFLVANISPKVVFRIFFLTLSSADIDFLIWKLWWKIYTIQKTFSNTRRVELVGKKKFAVVALNPEYETFVVYVMSLSSVASLNFTPLNINIHSFCRP